MRIREYRGPLTVLVSGVVGFSLFCIVSAAAMSAPSISNTPINLQPQELVDSAISNINTVAALTYESISEFINTGTPSPTRTLTNTAVATNTATLIPTRTPITPTSTRRHSGSAPTLTYTSQPTRTHTPIPTNTPLPTFTNTPVPTFTNTPVPTFTDPPPPPTETSTPEPPTVTPEPPDPTATPEDTATSMSEPFATAESVENTENTP